MCLSQRFLKLMPMIPVLGRLALKFKAEVGPCLEKLFFFKVIPYFLPGQTYTYSCLSLAWASEALSHYSVNMVAALKITTV